MKSFTLACALAAMSASAVSLRAEEPVKTVELLPGGYTFEQVHTALTKMGYEFSGVTPEKNQCTIVVDHDDLTIYVLVTVNTEQQYVWFGTTLASIKNPDNVSATLLQKMLEENEKISPAFFQYNAKSKRISLQHKFENRDWSPARLRREIETYYQIVRATKSLWTEEILENSIPAPAEGDVAEFARLQGEYRIVPGTVSKGQRLAEIDSATAKKVLTFLGNRFSTDGGAPAEIRLSEENGFKAIDFIGANGKIERAIYRIEGDLLILCHSDVGKPRPTGFDENSTEYTILVLQRIVK